MTPGVGLGRTVPALPVRSVVAATAYYTERLGFAVGHQGDGLAVLTRDDAVVQLWEAADERWRERTDLADGPVRSGAESFLAGTGSCRIEAVDIPALWTELAPLDVLHPVSRDGVLVTDYGTHEVNAVDLDGNLLTFFRWI